MFSYLSNSYNYYINKPTLSDILKLEGWEIIYDSNDNNWYYYNSKLQYSQSTSNIPYTHSNSKQIIDYYNNNKLKRSDTIELLQNIKYNICNFKKLLKDTNELFIPVLESFQLSSGNTYEINNNMIISILSSGNFATIAHKYHYNISQSDLDKLSQEIIMQKNENDKSLLIFKFLYLYPIKYKFTLHNFDAYSTMTNDKYKKIVEFIKDNIIQDYLNIEQTLCDINEVISKIKKEENTELLKQREDNEKFKSNMLNLAGIVGVGILATIIMANSETNSNETSNKTKKKREKKIGKVKKNKKKISSNDALFTNENLEYYDDKIYKINNKDIYVGPRGGNYYYNDSGTKTYI